MKRLLFCVVMLFALGACDGDEGPMGPAGADGASGPAGADGADGPAGTDGTDFPGPLPAGYVAADGILGGAAYSKWYVTDAGGTGAVVTTVPADFYRCKACHAWDGLGNSASYANRTGQSTLNPNRPDVSAINLRSSATAFTPQALFDLVMHSPGRTIDAFDNTHPDFAMHLTVGQTWNLVKFMREEWVEPTDLYDLEVSGGMMYVDYSGPTVMAPTLTYSNIGAMGNAANGITVYGAACGGCHGADGTSIPLGSRSLGQFVREKPNEAWFKAKFGEAGSMDPGLVTSTSDLQDLYAALVNTGDYPDLP
ncbi:MAG: hypothetical protein V3S56_00655 [Gemmatimonadota bacterium]